VGADGSVAELPAVGLVGVVILEEAMQERGMRGVDADFECLQPVAVDVSLEGERVVLGRDEAVEFGKRRRLARTHVGEHDAVAFDARVRRRADLGVEGAAGRFCRLFQAGAVDVKQPAVERAAQPAVLDRKSTRLNSSHVKISYAVFCLKKKMDLTL